MLKFIIGPCVIESEELAIATAKSITEIESYLLGLGFNTEIIYKSSFSKDTRRSADSFHGVGAKEGLRILSEVASKTGLAVTSDVHNQDEGLDSINVLDIIQIPHHLSRASSLLESVARSPNTMSIKKGAGMTITDIKSVVNRIKSINPDKSIIIIERGNHFGYDDQIIDFRNITRLKETYKDVSGVSICVDVSHAAGNTRFVEGLALAAASQDVDYIFIESHPSPDQALCDGHVSYPLGELRSLLTKLCEIDRTVSSNKPSISRCI